MFPIAHDDRLDTREIFVERTGCSLSSLVVNCIKDGKGVTQLVHGGHVGEPETGGDVVDGALPHDQHVLGVVLGEHLEGGVGHHHLVLRHGHLQPVRQLVRLLLPQRVPCVRDKDGRNPPPLLVLVVQQRKRLRGGGKDIFASDYDAIDVKHDAEVWT